MPLWGCKNCAPPRKSVPGTGDSSNNGDESVIAMLVMTTVMMVLILM
jgi:hypothetical protein